MFGGIVIERSGVPVAETADLHKALAVLALVAASRERGISRDQLAAYLWPESVSEHARAALSQKIYVLRKQLAEPALFLGTRTLQLNSASIGSDLSDFKQALGRDDYEGAVEMYSGPFLHGFFVDDAVELERWIESERAYLAQQWAAAIESIARRAAERGDHVTAARLWRRLTFAEPGNSRAVAALVSALVAAGDRAGALREAHSHDLFLRADFDAGPDPVVAALVKEIRQSQGPTGAARDGEQPHSSYVGQDNHRVPIDNLLGDVTDTIEVSEAAPRAAARRDGLTRAPPVALARSRSRRVARFAIAIGGSVAVIGLGGLLARQRARRDVPAFSERRIAVAPFRNETGDSALAFVGRIAVDWVVQSLVQTQLVEVVAPGFREASLPRFADRPGTPNAGLIVRGSYARSADSLVLQVQIVEAATGRVVRAVGPVSGPLLEPLVAIERLRQRLAGALATLVDRRLSRWSDAASQPASFEAYRAFDEGLAAFFSANDGFDFAKAGRLLVHAAAIDTQFSVPLVWSFYAFSNAGDSIRSDSVLRAFESRRERLPRLDRALLDALTAISRLDPVARHQAFQEAVAIAPNSEWVYKLADVAFELHRIGETDSLLTALDPDGGWIRDWPGYWRMRSNVAYEQGRHEDELSLAMRGDGRNPGDRVNTYAAGRALASLGRKAELLAFIDQGLASSPPRMDSYDLLRIMSAARLHGHIDIAAEIARRALQRPMTGIPMVDSILGRARFEMLIFETSEDWNGAVKSARQLIRLDSLRRHHDALPYIVLLEAAVRRGVALDTTGLEAKALAEAAARRKADGWSDWLSEYPLVARAELSALRGDTQQAAAMLQEAVAGNVWDPKTEWAPSERAVFDRVRGDPALSHLLHVPALDRRAIQPSR